MRHHTNAEAVTQKYFFEKLLRNIFTKITVKSRCQRIFFKTVASFRSANLLKRNFSTWDLLCVVCSANFILYFFIGQILVAISEEDHKNEWLLNFSRAPLVNL